MDDYDDLTLNELAKLATKKIRETNDIISKEGKKYE